MKRYLNHTSPILATGYGLLAVSIPYSVYILFLDIPKVFETDPPGCLNSHLPMWLYWGVELHWPWYFFIGWYNLPNRFFPLSVTYVIPIVALLGFWMERRLVFFS
ncbi:MAG: hypothetical protein R3B93_16625 [Bacteroidia bacterium]